MKKVLFASTALVAGAIAAPQFAAAQDVSAGNADISFGGYARWGLHYDDTRADELQHTSRYRLQIDASTETDGGISLHARVRMEVNNGNAGGTMNAARFGLSVGDFTMRMGNIAGALESMPGQYPIDLGLTGLGYDYVAYGGNGDAYSSGGAGAAGSEGIEFIYSSGDFGVHLSHSDDTSDPDPANHVQRLAAHVSYNFSDWTVALGVQDSDNTGDTDWTVSVGGSIGSADVTFAYADNGDSGDRAVIAAQFDVGANTDVGIYVASNDPNTVGASSDTGFGIDFNHGLGGGASVRGGLTQRFSGATQADLGIRFNF